MYSIDVDKHRRGYMLKTSRARVSLIYILIIYFTQKVLIWTVLTSAYIYNDTDIYCKCQYRIIELVVLLKTLITLIFLPSEVNIMQTNDLISSSNIDLLQHC